MRQTAISFKSKKLTLEGVVATPEGLPGPFPVAVLCHPHPLFGGSMDNTVVMAIARALDETGLATLRFNFRGVGASEGEFSKGAEEQQDILAALKLVKQLPHLDARRLALAGYSFGAQVILQGLDKYKRAKALALLSPPPSSFNGSPVATHRKPKLFLVGDADRLAQADRLQEQVATLHPSTRLQVIPGADHSWRGYEEEAAQRVAGFLVEVL